MPKLPFSSKNQEEKNEVRTLKKKAVPKKTGKGRKAGAARQPRALRCQLLQQRGRDPEHPIMIEDEVNEVGPILACFHPFHSCAILICIIFVTLKA
jgi:hypothetical protein